MNFLVLILSLWVTIMPMYAIAGSEELDPFAGVSSNTPAEATQSNSEGFFSENFGFRDELMSEFGANDAGYASSRQSVGFEIQKKFSSETKTFSSVDFQARLVRRDGFVDSPNDMGGANQKRWALEYENAYLDFYNFLDPLLSEEGQSAAIGRFNTRIGHFYVPFGLNLQTDTHGTVLQLSNGRNFGFDMDWYAGFWGNLSEDFRYDVYYLAGSGDSLKFEGQGGLGAARLSLANKYASQGWEGGISFLAGRRLASDMTELSPAVEAESSTVVKTQRFGLDGRYKLGVSTGLLTWTSEFSGGRDVPDKVFTQLHQLDYLHHSRRWGLATQYRQFWQDMKRDRELTPLTTLHSSDSAILAEATWYFRNDVAGSNLHWIKLNYENQLTQQRGSRNVIWTLQYYRYM